MARTDVFLSINASSPAAAVVTSQTDLTVASFPELVLGDAPLFSFYFTDGTASWPSWAGNGNYSLEWALSDLEAQPTPWAYTAAATTITGGWSVRLPLGAGRLVNELNARRISQDNPVVYLWQHIRVVDSSGYAVSYAVIKTRVRYRAVAGSSESSDTPTTTFTPAQLSSFNASANASGNTTASIGTYAIQHVEEVTISGAGSTTRVLVLPTTGRNAGNVCLVRFLCPATAGITLEVRDATSGGTLLLSATTDGSGDDVAGEFYYTGSAWKPHSAQFAT